MRTNSSKPYTIIVKNQGGYNNHLTFPFYIAYQMRRVSGFLLAIPFLCSGQYVDTIQGRLTVKYNNPDRSRFSALVVGGFETQGMDGGVMVPFAGLEGHVKPLKFVTLYGSVSQQFQLGWQLQEIKDTRHGEIGGRIFLKRKTIDKTKTFTAGTLMWNYDFLFPVKVMWSMGLSGGYRFGSGVFNSGIDDNTAVRFRNTENQKITFIERAAVPYTFQEISAGLVVSTASNMKVQAHLPAGGSVRTRRMKTFTEFRLEAVVAPKYNFDEQVRIKVKGQSDNRIEYDVLINRRADWGLKFQGLFKRKAYGFKIETGLRPGIHYRFSGGERNSVLDRSYLLFGFGFGWM